MNSIKKNFFYNSLLTAGNYIIPLIIFPYITRVLGVSNIGICDFVDSIINYFTIFATLGLTTVAVRECAYNKDNAYKLSKTFSSLLTLNIVLTILMTMLLIVLIFIIPKFYEYRHLMFIGVSKLIFKALLIEWLYTGIENFKYITIRNLIVRIVYVVAVFIFVRTKDDFIIYYALTSAVIVVNALINLFNSKTIVKFSFKLIVFKPYLKSVITLGVYSILTSMYTTFNITYLGFVSGNEQVGYYSTAIKLHSIILSLFTAFTGVMMPRMVSLLSNDNIEPFKQYVRKSIKFLISFAFPVIIYGIVYSDCIINVIAGYEYESAIPCMRIVMPLILVVGYEQILVLQILTPLKRDSEILLNSFIGALIGVLANILLVSSYGCIGTAFTWCLSEIAVMFMAQYFVQKQIGDIFPRSTFLKYVLIYIPLVCVLFLVHMCDSLGLWNLMIGGVVVVLYFMVIEVLILKNEIIIGGLNWMKSVFMKNM